MRDFRQVFNQTSFQIIGKIITSISTLLILRIVAQNYGESGTGILTLVLTYLSMFALVLDLGVNAYILPRLLGNNIEIEWRKLLGLRTLLVLFLLPLLWVLAFLWFWVNPTNEIGLFKDLVLITSVVYIAQSAIFISAGAILQSKQRYDLSSLTSSISAFSTLAAVYLISKINPPLEVIFLGYNLGWLITALLSLLLVKLYLKRIYPIIDFSYIKEVFKKSWAISLTLVLNVIYFRLDSFLVSFFKSFSDVGIYNLAFSIFQAALVIPTFIMNSFYPLMLKRFNRDKNEFKKIIIKATTLMFCIGLIGLGISLLLADFVVLLLTSGKGFYGSADALRILSLSFPAFFSSAVLMWTLVTIKKYKTMLLIYIAGLLFNTILNLIYIPYFSYMAAAVTTVISEYLILIIQIFILYQYFRK